jgi:NDP-sugar pyrophosphorylase family protein
MKVLLTTSGTGSRLSSLTKYKNKSLIRVGEMPTLSHIIKMYPDNTEFVVTLGYLGHLVRQYIEIAHPDKNVTFIDVDNYQGPGSSLLYSMFCAKSHLDKEPFIFHACDTIAKISDFSLNENWLCGYPTTNNTQYRTFNVQKDGVITKLNEKGETKSDYDYIGICGIKDFESFWTIAEKTLNDTDGCPSDYDVILKMINETSSFSSVITDTWHDVGNPESLNQANKEVVCSYHVLDKEDEDIYIVDDNVIKFFYNETICEDRVIRSSKLNGIVPKVVTSSNNFYSYEYQTGSVVSSIVNRKIFSDLLEWSKDNLWKPVVDDGEYERRCMSFYKDKSMSRLSTFCKSNNIVEEPEIINGKQIPTMFQMLSELDYKGLHHHEPSQFHGDFILENIIKTDTGFTLIDWRQDFSGSTSYGDLYYDLAKLNHNLIFNHDYITQGLYKYSVDREVVVDLSIPFRTIECQEILKQFCTSENIPYSKIKTLTSLVWLNMSALHVHPLDKFLYYFSRYNMFNSLEK